MVKNHSDSERGNPLPPHVAARVLLYASSHREDSTYHSLYYTSRGVLVGTRNSSVGPLWRIHPTTHHTMSEHPYHGATSRSKTMEYNTYKLWLLFLFVVFLTPYPHCIDIYNHTLTLNRIPVLNLTLKLRLEGNGWIF